MLERLAISLDGLVLTFGSVLADWNETHVFNPRWPPHAKYFPNSVPSHVIYNEQGELFIISFHNAQTITLSILLGLATLFYTWCPAATPGLRKIYLNTVILCGSDYKVAGYEAYFFPGSNGLDPGFGGPGFPQIFPFSVSLGLCITGALLEYCA